MRDSPTRDVTREEVREPWRITREWFEAYNRVDNETKRRHSHFPLVTFGGAELYDETLDERVFREPSEMTARGRDPGWSHSVVDRWAVHQPSARKAHLLVDFRRCRANGAPYGVGHSRLTVFTKEAGAWGARVLSSCGLRNPDAVGALTDEAREVAARRTVERLRRVAADGDESALREACHLPFVRLDGPTFELVESREELSFDVDDAASTELAHQEVLAPQSADKLLVDLSVRRRAADGADLDPAERFYLLTRKDGEWGLQMSSSRAGIGGLP